MHLTPAAVGSHLFPYVAVPVGAGGRARGLLAPEQIAAVSGVGSIGLPTVAVLGGVFVLLLGGALLLIRRSRADSEAASAAGDTDEGESATARLRSESGSKAESKSGANAGSKSGSTDVPPSGHGAPPIRTDEEHVVRLLIANHGRMKQSQIVEETDWSKAKVSRLLSRMEAHDQIVRRRAGRENVVQLADANVSVSS